MTMPATLEPPKTASPGDGHGDARGTASGARDDFAAVLARFACALTIADLPPAALTAAKMNVFDTLACAAAGTSAPAVGETRELAIEWGGAPQATILGFGDKVPAHHAAWVNGTMSHARDYDDTHDAAVLHAGVSVIPAALAAAELKGRRGTPVSGADFLCAIAAGLETICRLGVATRIGIVESGWIYTPLFGYFAATVAAGRVLGLDVGQMINALGIVYSQTAGNHQVTRDGALTKRMQPGFAAQAALVSVQLAERGVRGAQDTFEGADGFLRVYLHDRCDRDALRAGLAERWEFANLSYKPYPCCRFDHTAIDAALQLRAAGVRADDVRRIRVGLNNQAYEAVCTPVAIRKAPRTIVHAQFSVPFTVAAAFVDGGVKLGHFTEASIRRPDLLALAARVDTYVDADIESEWGRNISPADMTVELKDGTTRHVRIDLPLGHPQRPMSTADFDVKAADCCAVAARPLTSDTPQRLRALVDGLEQLDDARKLVRALVPQEA